MRVPEHGGRGDGSGEEGGVGGEHGGGSVAGFGVDGEWAGGEVEGDFCGLAAGRIVQVCLGVAAGGSEEEVQLGGEAVVVRDDGVEGRFLVGLDALVGVRLERWEGGGVAVPDCVRVGERRANL